MWFIKGIGIVVSVFVILYWWLPLDYICDYNILFSIISAFIFCFSLHFLFQPYKTIWDVIAVYLKESKESEMKKSEIVTVSLLIIPFILIFDARIAIRIDHDIDKNRQEVTGVLSKYDSRPGRHLNHFYFTVNYTYNHDDFTQELEVPREYYYQQRKSNKVIIEISRRNPLFARVKIE